MNIDDILNSNHVRWMDATEDNDADIVISSRVRLARNFELLPFPHLLNMETGRIAIEKIRQAWENSQDPLFNEMVMVTFDQLSNLDRQILVEKHLISPEHSLFNDKYRGVFLNHDGSLALMVNEEDHLRIQCLLPGFDLESCYSLAQRLDDEIEKHLPFAFDELRGYLTSCPTNVGTGMRASVMLHLPGMAITGQSAQVFRNIGQLGMTVRGLYGEGTEVVGNLYQLSNQVTLGLSEEDILNNLNIVTQQMIEQERMIRRGLKSEMPYQLRDRVGRAYGVLTHACIMPSNEALTLLSDLRLGIDLGIITQIKPAAMNELVVAIRPSHLQKRAGQEMDAFHRDIKRAEVIQDILSH